MSSNDPVIGRPDDAPGSGPLELLTDEEGLWTAVPMDAEGDQRLTHWISVEADVLCELEEWR